MPSPLLAIDLSKSGSVPRVASCRPAFKKKPLLKRKMKTTKKKPCAVYCSIQKVNLENEAAKEVEGIGVTRRRRDDGARRRCVGNGQMTSRSGPTRNARASGGGGGVSTLDSSSYSERLGGGNVEDGEVGPKI